MRTYPIIDGHCDVLWKLWNDSSIDFYDEHAQLHAGFSNLKKGEVALQSFALFLSPKIPRPQMFYELLHSIDLFYQKVVQQGSKVQLIRTKEDLAQWDPSLKLGALLTLEGLDPLIGDSVYLRTLFHLGVRSIGFTWNQANLGADGVGEERGAGLTEWGKEVVRECNRLGMMIDISHISYRGFWDVLETTDRPIIASHSNCFSLCPHVRNLKDDQLDALIRSNGMIGVTTVPSFVAEQEPTIDKLIGHIDYIFARGGTRSIGLGSDFDGIESTLPNLSHSGQYQNLVERLYKMYASELVEGLLWNNWYHFYESQLPLK